jgi:hypothetical protein
MMKNKKQQISIEASRKALFKDLKKKCGGKVIKKTIRFTNNDVPDFLKELKKIEQKSKQVEIMVY